MKLFSDNKIDLVKNGKVTAFLQIVDPQPVKKGMFKDDLSWYSSYCSCTISNKPNGPDGYFRHARYGQVGDYFHIYGLTLHITDVNVFYAENISGEDKAAVIGCTPTQLYSQDYYDDWPMMGCNETDYVFLYKFKYIDTPPMEDMIKLASACKAIASI